MDCEIYQYEINQIVFLQNNFKYFSKLFLLIHDCLNAKILFNILIPLLSGLDKEIFLRTTFGALVADYLNSLFRWYFAEVRPHWWNGEAKKVRIMQFEGTCECTPGCPSSETMILAAVLFILLSSFMKKFPQRFTSCCRTYLWMAYVSALILVSLAQVFLGVHFLHQCILGAVAGILIGSLLSSNKFTDWFLNLSKMGFHSLIISMFVSDVCSYWVQRFFGIDPNWSTKEAFKWCENSNAILPESLIMYSLMRNLGMFIDSSQASYSSGCFTASSTVLTESGERRRLSELRIGERVLSVDGETGRPVFSEVMLFLDRNTEEERQFVHIETEDGTHVTVTPSHLLMNVDSTGRRNYVFADSIVEGDMVLVAVNGTTLASRRVARVSVEISRGVFAPLTRSGTIVVDSVAASCYALVESQTVAHFSFLPIRAATTVSRWFSSARVPEASRQNGIHWYAKALYAIKDYVLPAKLLHHH
ncbi:hypothetical protein DMENIID0001_010390 [Sergentomyia squamirostris]